MPQEYAGYAYLTRQFELPVRHLMVTAEIDSAAKGRQTRILGGDVELLRFEPRYRPKTTLAAHLQFALRYEGINLEVLALLFGKTGQSEIEAAIAAQPESRFFRRIGFLYEWLTGKKLHAEVAPKATYVPVVDEAMQFVLSDGPRDSKFKVINNLPGNKQFCPMVRKTEFLKGMVEKNLKDTTARKLAQYDPELLSRAAAFLYLKETHSSFEVEREKPSPARAQRFSDLLREAENSVPLSEERFVELQNAVLDPRFHEFAYRGGQNWIGQDLGYRKKVDFVPARPEDVRSLMDGLVSLAGTVRTNPASLDPVIAASVIAFGFVFIHPFMDGNGRLHRFLIHDVLASSGFTPKGIVLPVSAVILANQKEYVDALERFSRWLRMRTTYNPEPPEIPATGNDSVYFRYFDATEQASFLYWALERTVEHDLGKEISFLLGFDKAYSELKNLLDWPAHSLDLFIQLVHQNGRTLSKSKHSSHFSWMTEEEVRKSEKIVINSFEQNKP